MTKANATSKKKKKIPQRRKKNLQQTLGNDSYVVKESPSVFTRQAYAEKNIKPAHSRVLRHPKRVRPLNEKSIERKEKLIAMTDLHATIPAEFLERLKNRPTEFDDRFCEQLIHHMSKRLSFSSFAGELLINRETLFKWHDNFPQFAAARKVWEEIYRRMCEESMDANAHSNFGNARTTIFRMVNRFNDEWTNKTESEVSISANKGLLEYISGARSIESDSQDIDPHDEN